MKRLIALLLTLLFVTTSVSADAHAQLAQSNPKVGSTLTKLPKTIELVFDDDLLDVPGSNLIQVIDPKGVRLETGAVKLIGARLSIAIKASTRLGRYKVTYRVLSADGHVVAASYPFYLAKKK